MKINSLGLKGETLAGRVLTFRELQFWGGGGYRSRNTVKGLTDERVTREKLI